MMQKSVIGMQMMRSTPTNKTNTGFTLIEILVVLVIMGIVISLAAVAVGDGIRRHQISNTAEELSLLLNFIQDEAILQSATFGFGLSENAFQFYRFSPEAKPAWQLITRKHDRILGQREVPSYIQLQLRVNNKAVSKQTPKLMIYNDGTMTPFTLFISETDKPISYTLRGKSNGEINLTQQEES